jgi:cell division topological specificity factor
MLNDLFSKWRGTKKSSSQTAKQRLQCAIVYDNLEVSDDVLISLKSDIIDVLSKYFKIDSKAISLDIERSKDSSSLILNTPILSTIRR